MQRKTLSAGDPIESRCTKCRTLTNHIVVAMVDDQPSKVQCNTCGGQHKYRAPAAPKAAKAPKKTAVRRTVDPKVSERKEWADLRPDMNVDKAADYSMTAAFKVGSVMRHPVFGLGLVQRAVGPQKIEVLFEDGKKIMRCQ